MSEKQEFIVMLEDPDGEESLTVSWARFKSKIEGHDVEVITPPVGYGLLLVESTESVMREVMETEHWTWGPNRKVTHC